MNNAEHAPTAHDHTDPTVRAGEHYWRQKEEINRKYRGHARKARLLINDLTYGLTLIEGELGAEHVRENWRKYVDRAWSCVQTEQTRVRDHLLSTINYAAGCYVEPSLASRWKNPRSTERVFFATDRDGVDQYLVMGLPTPDEAAEAGVAFLSKFDPELAAHLGIAALAPLIELWLDRRKNEGRRGKTVRLDESLCALLKQLGYGRIEPEAMRRHRLGVEKKVRTVPREQKRS
jgi:hypothetical protein